MAACPSVKRAHRQGVPRSRPPSNKDYIRIGIHAPYRKHQGAGVVSVDVDPSGFAGTLSIGLTRGWRDWAHGREQVGAHGVQGRRC